MPKAVTSKPRKVLLALLLFLFVSRTESPGPIEAPLAPPVVEKTDAVSPVLALTAGVAVQDANNNLDVVRHKERVYLAFRTAPNHFASPDTTLFVVSSDDEQQWRYETHVSIGSDIREPRLLSFGDQLFVYFAVLGSNMFAFEPSHMMGVRRDADGRWGDPRPVYRPGFIPWRTRTVDGKPYMVSYGDGRHIYTRDGVPIEIHWLTSDDGWDWRPAGEHAAVLKGGGSEADFVPLAGGGVVAVIRNEAGDGAGWGSKICRGEPTAPGRWTCVQDRRKFDSPLLFKDGNDVFLVARRHLSATGDYDLGFRGLPDSIETAVYQLDYWRYPKRCALWRVDAEKLAVTWQADLPSRGDTCFPAVAAGSSGTVAIYNYSSPIDGPDVPWLVGQLGKTGIYRSLVTLNPAVAQRTR